MAVRKTDPARPLAGQVAVVAGATRGAGRGIARALGEAGAFVYCTGRSVRGEPSSYNRPETIEETAEIIQSAGGSATAVRVDHTIEADVRAMFDRVFQERGRLDVLGDSVAGEDPALGSWTAVWNTGLEQADTALRQALLSHVITAKHASAHMRKQRHGLIVQVTEGDMLFGGGNVVADLVKSGLKGLAARLAEELRPHRVAAVAVTPGYLRSESMLQHFGVTPATWRDGGKKDSNFLASESPLFVGRAVAALAADRHVLQRSGDLISSWEAARTYGFTDEGGERPDWGLHWRKILPSMPGMKAGQQRHAEWLDRISARAKAYVN